MSPLRALAWTSSPHTATDSSISSMRRVRFALVSASRPIFSRKSASRTGCPKILSSGWPATEGFGNLLDGRMRVGSCGALEHDHEVVVTLAGDLPPYPTIP